MKSRTAKILKFLETRNKKEKCLVPLVKTQKKELPKNLILTNVTTENSEKDLTKTTSENVETITTVTTEEDPTDITTDIIIDMKGETTTHDVHTITTATDETMEGTVTTTETPTEEADTLTMTTEQERTMEETTDRDDVIMEEMIVTEDGIMKMKEGTEGMKVRRISGNKERVRREDTTRGIGDKRKEGQVREVQGSLRKLS
jgi:hypothetical protein